MQQALPKDRAVKIPLRRAEQKESDNALEHLDMFFVPPPEPNNGHNLRMVQGRARHRESA